MGAQGLPHIPQKEILVLVKGARLESSWSKGGASSDTVGCAGDRGCRLQMSHHGLSSGGLRLWGDCSLLSSPCREQLQAHWPSRGEARGEDPEDRGHPQAGSSELPPAPDAPVPLRGPPVPPSPCAPHVQQHPPQHRPHPCPLRAPPAQHEGEL